MKRFYCTICQSIKRVQSWPADIHAFDTALPQDRRGTCDYHTNPTIARQLSAG